MLGDYLKSKGKMLFFVFLSLGIFLLSFALYHLPLMAVLYPVLLVGGIGILVLCMDYLKVKKRHLELEKLTSTESVEITTLPEAQTVNEKDYQNLIQLLCEEKAESDAEAKRAYQEMIDYYTVWAHQIKTPIASMSLNLQNEDSDFARLMKQDLGRIERYVEMVLTFLRLGSDSTDYVFQEYDLDSIVRPAVKKFAGEFIGKHLRLTYSPLEKKVVTDEKWLTFVIEQIVSNAVKYTSEGGVSIYMKDSSTLCIEDTGIGIAAEDLPRIFERGYTGYNGRMDKKASGIGLYLCKQICQKLGLEIQAFGEAGKGTRIEISQL